MSTIDYKALAERVAQRAIYADNNADPNNKAWAADLRAVVSLLNGMAEAQPVAWRCEVRDLLTQAEQCLSTAVQFEQFAYDEPPSYVSAWDYEADHIAAGIRAVLAAAPAVPQADAQPVAEVNDRYSRDGYNDEISVLLPVGTKLYTQPAVPPGWKLVPVEPTPEMLHAEVHGSDWNGRSGDERARAVWAAVLAAAPAAPQEK